METTIKIAIIDDDPLMVETVADILTDELNNVTIYSASNPVEGLRLIAREQVNIVLSDVKMPFVNGADLLLACKHLKNGCQVILFSGQPNNAAVMEAFQDGARGFLCKPFQREELINLVRRCIAEIEQWNQSMDAVRLKQPQ